MTFVQKCNIIHFVTIRPFLREMEVVVMKKVRRLLTMFLAVIMVFSTSLTAFANSTPIPSNRSETNSNVVVTDTGIYINGTYYSQKQFIRLLDTAQEVDSPQTRSAIALVAGTWWIPGIGEVVITAAGAVIVAGAIVEVGSWVYNAVVDWFADRAVQQAYENAKEAGEPTDDHSTQSTSEGSLLPKTGRPNSSKDLKDKDGVKQRRYYDKDGNADMDIDYRHGGTGHTFPHRHDWNNGVRGDAY